MKLTIALASGALALAGIDAALAQSPNPAAIAGEAYVLGIQSQTNGSSPGATSSFQRSIGSVAFDVSSVMDGAFATQFGKGIATQAGQAYGASSGLGASGSSASMQGGLIAFTQFAAFPEAAFTGFAVGIGR